MTRARQAISSLREHMWRLVLAGGLAAALVAVAGCGSERSAKAYCAAYHKGFDRLKSEYPDVDQYSHTTENPFILLLRTTSAFGDVVALIGDMADVAPDEIQTDTQRVHDTLQKQLDTSAEEGGNLISGNYGGALGNVASGLLDSVANAGAVNRMDQYVVDHCGGRHMFAASPQ